MLPDSVFVAVADKYYRVLTVSSVLTSLYT